MSGSSTQEVLASEVSSEAFLAAVIVLVVIPGLFVTIRIANNMRLPKGLFLEDWLSVLAMVFLATSAALFYTVKTKLYGVGINVSLKYIGRLVSAVGFIGVWGVYFSKLPIIVLYMRVFGVHTSVRVTCWILVVAPFIMVTGSAIYATTYCSPENKEPLDLVYLMKCIQPSLAVGVWNNCIGLVVDIALFIMPLPIIAKLHLAARKRFGLALVFLMGFFGIAANITTLYYRGVSLAALGSPGAEIGQMLGQIIESSIAIIVGCVPALRSFWRGHIVHLQIYSKVAAAFSFKKSLGGLDLKKQTPSHSSEDINGYGAPHQHVELDFVKAGTGNGLHVTNTVPYNY